VEPSEVEPHAPEPSEPEAVEAAPPVTRDTPITLVERRTEPGDVVLSEDHTQIEQLSAFGVRHPAERYCTEETRINPGDLFTYHIEGRPELVFHCPGSLDGDMNVVTVFGPGEPPRSRSIRPEPTSHIIIRPVLQRTVKQLLMAR
jgi:hypothetical protein